jgi:DNA recombination protein RmuC
MRDGILDTVRQTVGAIDPLVIAAVVAALAGLLIVVAISGSRRSRDAIAVEDRIEELARMHGETTGRLQTMAEVFSTRQADLARLLGERIEGLGHRVGSGLAEGTKTTGEQLERLAERLAVIDRAQKSLGDLAGEVLSLRQILANKQSRGAFGQGRMEAIVGDGLPASAFSFQETLSNGNRPDCLVRLPNGAPSLVIDAKFPLEAFERAKSAETDEVRVAAEAQARRDLMKHVGDVRQRYFIPGETHDTALIFVPSESLFADIHERLPDVVERAARVRVLLVSPSLLMLSIQLVQAMLRDVRMREQAHIIQNEVRNLMEDVERLRDRTLNLQKHFGQANGDVEQILISADKIVRRSTRIDGVGFEDEPARPAPSLVSSP